MEDSKKIAEKMRKGNDLQKTKDMKMTKEKEKNVSMFRYAGYLLILIGMLLGLTYLLSS